MNDSISILLATTILALGGLGLYMYKTSDDKEEKSENDKHYNEDSIFGSNFWGSNQEDLEEDLNLEEEEDYKPRRRGGKTQRNRKTTGSSRRRY